MTRNLKVLGVALVAALAMSAVVASTASANSEYWFRSDGSPTTLVGKQTTENGDSFKLDGGEIRCKTVSLGGLKVGTTFTTVNVTPNYKGCTFTGSLTMTINMKSCYYQFHTDGYTTNGQFHVEAAIECTNPGDEIIATIETGLQIVKCVIHVPPQNFKTGAVLTNNAFKTHLTAKILFTNAKYSQTEGTGIGKCPTDDNTANGVYTGEVSLEGVNEAGMTTAIWVE